VGGAASYRGNGRTSPSVRPPPTNRTWRRTLARTKKQPAPPRFDRESFVARFKRKKSLDATNRRERRLLERALAALDEAKTGLAICREERARHGYTDARHPSLESRVTNAREQLIDRVTVTRDDGTVQSFESPCWLGANSDLSEAKKRPKLSLRRE